MDREPITTDFITSSVDSVLVAGLGYYLTYAISGGLAIFGITLFHKFGWFAVFGIVFFATWYVGKSIHYNTITYQNDQDIINNTPRGIKLLNDHEDEHAKYDFAYPSSRNAFNWFFIKRIGLTLIVAHIGWYTYNYFVTP